MKRKWLLIRTLALALVLSTTACATVQIDIEQTPTADLSVGATLTALQKQNQVLSAQVATLAAPDSPLLQTDTAPEIIRQKMLFSYKNWKTVWVNAEISYFQPEGSTPDVQTMRQQVWISQQDYRFRVLIGPPGSNPQQVNTSDGSRIVYFDLRSGQSESQIVPSFVEEPFSPPLQVGDSIYPHPISGLMFTPLSDLIFPTGLAQRSGEIRVVGSDVVAGRRTLIVEWYWQENQLADRLWVDTETGMLLRMQQFGKSGGRQPSSDTTITAIEYDRELLPEMFNTAIGELPRFALDSSGAPDEAMAVEPTPASPEYQTLGGEVYFVINAHSDVNPLKLVRMPGACLLYEIPCQRPEEVPGFPNRSSMARPLVWSPDGQVALLGVEQQSNTEPAALYRFDPAGDNWLKLAEFDYVYDPVWSADGAKAAMVASRGSVQDIYSVNADGSNLVNLTEGSYTQGEAHFGSLAWLGERLLALRLNLPRHAGGETLVFEPGTKGAKAFTEFALPDTQMVASPDGSKILYVGPPDPQETLAVINVANGESERLASFQTSSIGYITWSFDSQWVAFTVSSSLAMDKGVSTVYVIRPDGTDLRQIYQSSGVLSIKFGPDSRHLLVEALDTSDVIRLYLTAVDSGESRLVQAPGLRLDANWQGPSWRRP